MLINPRISWQTTLIALAVITGVAGICSMLYLREADPIEKNLRDRELKKVEIFVQLWEKDIRSAISDLQFLDDGDGLHAYLSSHQQADLDRAIHRAVFCSRQEPDYDQIRYLDEHGQEIIRVNFNGAVAPRDQLQNKGDRPYFRKAFALAPGQIYISAFDLNVENGHVEEPFKPMLRFAMPVFDAAGQRRGVYIINYRGENLIARLQQFMPQYRNRLRIFNAQGYWLKAEQTAQEWGFMFPDRAGMTMARADPALWSRIVREPGGQVNHAGGLFSWNRIELARTPGDNPNLIVGGDDFLVIASEVSATEWGALFADLRETFMIVGAVLLALVLASWRFFVARQQAQGERDRFFTLSHDLLCIAGFDGYFKRLNPAWETTLGYSRHELLSRPFLEFVHPEDRERTIAEAGNLARGLHTISFENRYRCKDGSYRWFLWSCRSLVKEQLIFASARDLTDRKRDEGQVRKLNEQLKNRADLLEAANKELEAFSYSVSHDLRAPLRHVDGFVDLLSKNAADKLDERGLRYLNIIADSARQMGTLIDELLVFSQMGRVEMRRTQVEMSSLVSEAIESMKMDIEDRPIAWKMGVLPRVEADPAMARQVWINLIANAVKYTRPRKQAEIEIGCVDARHESVFFVRDNGVGFDMQYADKLFGVFQRLHRADEFEGTGIGLANVHRIITRHGGRTWAEGKIDGGATFFFSLPKTST
jgi:PAS domain S-box-containing protein